MKNVVTQGMLKFNNVLSDICTVNTWIKRLTSLFEVSRRYFGSATELEGVKTFSYPGSAVERL